jgi:hypothetical protein
LRIIRARATLSATAAVNLGDGLPISSRASRTAAMIAAAMTTVEAKRSSFCRCRSSHAIDRFISPSLLAILSEALWSSNNPLKFAAGIVSLIAPAQRQRERAINTVVASQRSPFS